MRKPMILVAALLGLGMAFVAAAPFRQVDDADDAGRAFDWRISTQPADASIVVNESIVQAFRQSRATRSGELERQVINYSRPIGLIGGDSGEWLKVGELNGDRVSVQFRVEFPALDNSQKAELAKELGGKSELYSFVPLGISGFQVVVSNGGNSEIVSSRPPKGIPLQMLGQSIPVNKVLENETLAKLIRDEREGTTIEVTYYSIFERVDAKGVSVTQFASNLENVLERYAGSRGAGKVIVTQDIKREVETSLATTMSIVIEGYGEDSDRGLTIAHKLLEQATSMTGGSWEDLLPHKADLVILGNDVIRLNLTPEEISNLKTKYATQNTMLNESRQVWNNLYKLVMESKDSSDFNSKYNREFASNNSFKFGLGVVVKKLPINLDLGTASGRSGSGSGEVRLTEEQFKNLRKEVQAQGEQAERLFEELSESWEGEVLINQLVSNLPNQFSLIDLAEIRRRSVLSLVEIEGRSAVIVPSIRLFDAKEKAGYTTVAQEELSRLRADVTALAKTVEQLQVKDKVLEDKLVALTATVKQNTQTVANGIKANKSSAAANTAKINNLSRRMGAPVKHEDGQWVHIGGGTIKEYTCPDGYVITGIRQEYHGGAWRNWIEKVHISRIVPAR